MSTLLRSLRTSALPYRFSPTFSVFRPASPPTNDNMLGIASHLASAYICCLPAPLHRTTRYGGRPAVCRPLHKGETSSTDSRPLRANFRRPGSVCLSGLFPMQLLLHRVGRKHTLQHQFFGVDQRPFHAFTVTCVVKIKSLQSSQSHNVPHLVSPVVPVRHPGRQWVTKSQGTWRPCTVFLPLDKAFVSISQTNTQHQHMTPKTMEILIPKSCGGTAYRAGSMPAK